MFEIQSSYQQAIKFSAARHAAKQQKVPGTNLPYVVHLSNVAMEVIIAGSQTPGFDLDFAVQVALLHDTIEDTETTFEEVSEMFGPDVAAGVLALTKNDTLPKGERIPDSLARIKKLQKEVWAVKLADRITNLQPPPVSWSRLKRTRYLKDAELILKEMKNGNDYLADRLKSEIEKYKQYL